MKIYIYKIVVLVVFVVAIVISNCSIINAHHKNEKKIIKVAVFDLGKSIFYDEDKQEYSGYLIDYLNKLKEYEQIDFEYKFGTWEEGLELAKNGEVDLCPFVTKTKEREKLYEFSSHSYGPESGFLYTNRNDIYFDDYENFDGKKIGAIKEFHIKNNFKDYANKHNFSYELIEFKDENDMLKGLDDGIVDMVLAESMQQFENYKKVARFQMQEYYFIAPKDNKVMEQINNAMSLLRWYEPKYDLELYKKYYDLVEKIPNFTRKELEYIKNSEPITMAVLGEKKVQSKYIENTNEFIGIEPDIVRKIGNITGLSIEMKPVEKEENLISMVQKEKTDIAIGIAKTNNDLKNPNIKFTDEIMNLKYVLVVRKNSKFNIELPHTIEVSKRFSAAREFIKKNYPNWKIIEENSPENRLKSVVNYEADCTIINRYELQYYFQIPEYENLTMYPVDYMNFEVCIVASNELDYRLVNILNKAIESIRYNSLDSIVNQNISKTKYHPDFSNLLIEYKEVVIIITLVFFVIIGLFILFSRFQARKNLEMGNYIKKLNNSNKELNLAYEKLKKAEKEAKKANEVKTEFLARMSHDMRTPMNAIISIADFGIEEYNKENEFKYFEQIKTSSLYLLGLLNDILETQKLESNEIYLCVTKFKLSKLFEEIESIVKYRAIKKNIQLKIDIDSEFKDYYIYEDKKRLEQVIVNIINNAIKYTKDFGIVICSAKIKKIEQENIEVEYTIIDNGVGMSVDFQKRMFEPFAQEYNDLSDDEFGTGLGLAIVNKIVQLMDGNVECISEAGKGTNIIVTLKHKIIIEELTQNIKALPNDYKILKGSFALVCEDNRINSKIVIKILKAEGIKVDLAVNGKEGLELIKKNKYDFVLMDIRMPVMDGLTATKKIRKFDKKIPIIALSANAYKEDRKKSIEAGMNAHLSKPINKEELFENLLKVLN